MNDNDHRKNDLNHRHSATRKETPSTPGAHSASGSEPPPRKSSSTSLSQFTNYRSSENLVDLEYGGPSLRDQSKRLSDMIQSRTELQELNPITPEQISASEETSGLSFWLNEAAQASEHGGDYAGRRDSALRAALGSGLIFSILIFPKQQILGATWIGNIFFHTCLKDSLGGSITAVIGFGRSIVLTTLFSWPIAFFLNFMSSSQAAIVLPFVTFCCSFLIMSCPQLTSRNLMILVMYIVVASVVREDIEFWEPLGWCATYLIGLCFAIIMNILPSSRTALASIHGNLTRLEKDMTMLMLQCKAYADNTATSPEATRGAIATIELLDNRIARTVQALKTKMPAAKTELSWHCQGYAAKDLNEWVVQAEKLGRPLKSLRAALVQRVLGEEYAMLSPTLQEAKAIIKEEIADARDRMVDAMIASVAVCHAWADPRSNRTVMPDVEGELAASLYECRQAFHRAMARAAEKLRDEEDGRKATMAHLTRRMTAFNALFELGDEILAYLEKHRWDQDEIKGTIDRRRPFSSTAFAILGFVRQDWLWYKPDSLRLALKTSVGMVLASLFVSVPYLWRIAQPFGVWPGLTIASVNLQNTGSSFHKASDRLFGTLLAAAYALLVSDLFPGHMDYVKIPAITFFTFVVVYLRNAEHAYKYTYAATSIGSMLYGSVKNDFNISGYIPKRIELIFIGIILFSLIELLLFPRSSRKMVEETAFNFFASCRDYLEQAGNCTKRMEAYIQYVTVKEINIYFMDKKEAFQLEKLAACHAKLKKNAAKLRVELESGLNEPHVGLSLQLDPESFRGLSKVMDSCDLQCSLLTKALRQIAVDCQKEDNPIRKDWPRLHTEFLTDAFQQAESCCEWLSSAYPDGRLRAQRGNSVKATLAAASFRSFEDVRLRTISKWSKNYAQLIQETKDADPVALMTLGITTTYILELCRQLQKAGLHVEKIAHRFPPK